MTIRCGVLLLSVAVLLAACAAPGPSPEPDSTCAQPRSSDEKKDGGLGGTGNAPDTCAHSQFEPDPGRKFQQGSGGWLPF